MSAIPITWLLRTFHPFLPARGPRSWRAGYSAEEVLTLLRGDGDPGRVRAARACAARVESWLPAMPVTRAYPSRYRERLPQLLHWYLRGESMAAIGRRMSPTGATWGVERSLAAACRAIAARLNAEAGDERVAWRPLGLGGRR